MRILTCCKYKIYVAVGRYAEYWKGVYTGLLPSGSEKNFVCIKVSKSK